MAPKGLFGYTASVENVPVRPFPDDPPIFDLENQLANMTLDEMTDMGHSFKEKAKVYINKMKMVEKKVKELKKTASAELTAQRRAELNEQKKAEAKEKRMEPISIIVEMLNGHTITAHAVLGDTMGSLRKEVVKQLKMPIRTSKQLRLLMDGMDISQSPRRTLLKIGLTDAITLTGLFVENDNEEDVDDAIDTVMSLYDGSDGGDDSDEQEPEQVHESE